MVTQEYSIINYQCLYPLDPFGSSDMHDYEDETIPNWDVPTALYHWDYHQLIPFS